MLVCGLLVAGSAASLSANVVSANGKIAGSVSDFKTGEALIGVSVYLEGTEKGAISDFDGNYVVKDVPPGTYSLRVQMVGYSTYRVEEVVVKSGESTDLSFRLEATVHDLGETIVVTAKALRNTQATLLKHRAAAGAVTDAISAQEISRSGSSDAAQAMTKVVGASVMDGRRVFIRGLGGRYTNTQLNGTPLPSPDPDGQNAPLDLVPASLLDNIMVAKTFTPDRPGDFAGGSVNMATKDYPERRTLVVSTSVGYNSNTTWDDGLLTHQSSGTDWIGSDDGKRDIPDIVLDNPELQEMMPNTRFLNVSQSGMGDTARLVEYIDASARAFSTEMRVAERKAPLNQSYSVAYGERWQLFGAPLGVVASMSYSRKVTSHEGTQGRYDRGSVNSDQLSPDYVFQDTKGTDEVLAGSLLSLKYGIHTNHHLGYTLMYNRNGESESRYLIGPWYYYTNDENAKVRNYVLSYTERALTSHQVSGQHTLFGGKVQADWQWSTSSTHQDDPDLRFFVDEVEQRQYEDEDGNLRDTTVYLIRLDRYMAPQRLYRELNEEADESSLNLTIPFAKNARAKVGTSYLKAERDHSERRFEYQNTTGYAKFNGDIDAYIADVGIDTVRTRVVNGDTVYQYIFTNFLRETTEGRNQYRGNKKIVGTYGMLDFPLTYWLRVVGGLRYETTYMYTLTQSASVNNRPGEIDEADWLPSLNLIFDLGYNMKVRSSFSRTLARPSLREITPSASVEFGTGDFYNGNPDLDITRIRNLDLRLEWFARPGEVVAASAFHKKIENPIELSIVGDNNDIVVINSEDATVYGVELEARRRLDWVRPWLANFTLGGNLTLAHSRVRIGDMEIAEIMGNYPDADEYREMAGQSPYILNLDLDYFNPGWGTQMSLFYNVFGERLAYNSDHMTPDVYEQPLHQLDLMVAQKLFEGATFKVSVRNLLDEDREFIYKDKIADARDEIYERISPGRDLSLGVSYEIW